MEYTVTIQHPVEIKEETYKSFVFAMSGKEAIKNFAGLLNVGTTELQISKGYAMYVDNGYILRMYF